MLVYLIKRRYIIKKNSIKNIIVKYKNVDTLGTWEKNLFLILY